MYRDYLLTKKEVRRLLKDFGVPYATEAFISFFFIREEMLGRRYYYPTFPEETIGEIIRQSGILPLVSEFRDEKDPEKKEAIRQKAYRLLERELQKHTP